MPQYSIHDPERHVPPGRKVRIPGRGTTFVRDVAGPPGAPAVVLLHGLGATAAVNWPGAFRELSSDFRVVALDHRGHGRGLRTPWPFRLDDCAEDVVRLADVLGIDHFIAAGYSMGGPIALLARRRHAARVSGVVLCATSARFIEGESNPSPVGAAIAAWLRVTPAPLRRKMAESMVRYLSRESTMSPVFLEEARRHDPAAILEATHAVRRFDARAWIGELGCPTASVITERDQFVPARSQLALAHAMGATIHRVSGDHDVALRQPSRFLPVLHDACRSVHYRSVIQTVI